MTLKASQADMGENEFHQFYMTITKAVISDKSKKDKTMRLRMVNSDVGADVFGERMSVELFKDFVSRINANAPIPAPFDEVVCEDSWCGGMPYLSISHFKAGTNEHNVPGEVEKVYVDGERLKSVAILYDNELGNAVWKSICDDLFEEKKAYENPVRVSIGFLDLEHKHVGANDDGSDYVFTRSKLGQKCSMCADGVEDKVYLKGQLVHKAFTRVPANERTSVEVEKMGKIQTREEDAKSIVGELAEELEKKSAVDDVLVVKEKDLEEYAWSVRRNFYDKFVPPQPELWVHSVTDKNIIVVEDGQLYRVKYTEKDGDFSFGERSSWEAVQMGFVSMKSKAKDSEWSIEFEKLTEKSDEPEAVMKTKVEETKEVVKEKDVVEEAVSTDVEKGESVDEPVAEVVEPEKSALDMAVEAFTAKANDLREKGVVGEEALKALQPIADGIGKATKATFTPQAQLNAEAMSLAMKDALPDALRAVMPDIIAGLAPMVAGSAAPSESVVRSITPKVAAPVTAEGVREMSQIEKIAYETTK